MVPSRLQVFHRLLTMLKEDIVVFAKIKEYCAIFALVFCFFKHMFEKYYASLPFAALFSFLKVTYVTTPIINWSPHNDDSKKNKTNEQVANKLVTDPQMKQRRRSERVSVNNSRWRDYV